jgi:hypothetical protein
MQMRLICEGCGQPVPIPDGYRRNKIQCSCGIICPLPESARQGSDAPPRTRPKSAAQSSPNIEEDAERWLLDDDPPAAAPPPVRDVAPKERPKPETKPAVERQFNCRRCGQLVRRQGECPSCDADKLPAKQADPVLWLSVDAPVDKDEDDEDSSPYLVEGADEVKCPECSMMLPPGSVLCVRCGFHLTKRKKVVKSYQPLARQWETNYSLSARRIVFGSCEALALALGLIGVFEGGASLGVFLGSFVLLTAMLGFLLGTFDHIRLTRDGRGRVQLTKTWRVCFFAMPPKTIDVRGFEGIASGRHRDVSSLDYLILFCLILSGLVPGLIWFYLAFYKVTFHVSLSRDHGYAAYVVYSGWDEMQMKEIAFALRDATGLRYDEG